MGQGINFGFKATTNIVILCARLGNIAKMVANHQKIIGMIAKVTRNDLEEAVGVILDAVSKHLSAKPQD